MGLGLGADERTAFLAKYEASRKLTRVQDLEVEVVVVDVSATCRSVVAQIKAQTKSPDVTPARVAKVLYDKMTRWHPRAAEFVWVFDSYTDLHQIRHLMYRESRYRKASRAQLDRVDPAKEVVVGGRIFKRASRPYADSDSSDWTVLSEINGDRVFNSGAAKRAFYELITRELVCLAAEYSGDRTVWVDSMRPHDADNAVICIRTSRDGVTVTPRPRGSKHGEADQKIAFYFASREDKGATAVWHTCDCDSIGQSVCIGLQCSILLPGLQLVEPFKLPQGVGCAMALLCNGGDYNDSMKYAQISSESLFVALDTLNPSGMLTVDADGIHVDVGTVIGFLGAHQPTRRKRSVYTVEGDPAHKFYRMRRGAEQAAAGKPTRTVLPTGAMVAHSIADLVRAVVYWMMGATPNSSDFGLMPDLYSRVTDCFLDAARPANVSNLIAAVGKEDLLLHFGI